MLQYAPTVTPTVETLVAPLGDYQDLYHQYLADITNLPPLEQGQDDALVQRLAQVRAGAAPAEEGQHIVQRLIEGSLRLVVYLATRHYRYHQAISGGHSRVSLMDLIQAGNLALMTCAYRCLTHDLMHPDFSAYAGAYIRGALINYYRRSVPVSVSKADWDEAGRNGTRFLLSDCISLDATSNGDDERPLLERLAAPTPLTENIIARERAEALLQTLPEREQRIVRLRYGLDPDDQRPHTYQEIAEKVGGCLQTSANVEQCVLRALREGVPLKTSPDYYSFSEACQVLGISHTAFLERVYKGVIRRVQLFSDDQQCVYAKTEIDALAAEYEHLKRDYYILEEVIALLGVCKKSVNNWARAGELTRYQPPGQECHGGLYPKDEVNRLRQKREDANSTYASHYYHVKEAAARLGISPVSLPRWVREGKLTRHTIPGSRYEGYPKDEVERLVQEQERLARDYYTTEQATARVGLSSTGFLSWALRVGIRPVRRTLDGVQDLYSKVEIDTLVEQEQQTRQACYTQKEATDLLGVSSSSLLQWSRVGKVTRVQLPGRENYGGLYLKTEIDAIRCQRTAQEVYA